MIRPRGLASKTRCASSSSLAKSHWSGPSHVGAAKPGPRFVEKQNTSVPAAGTAGRTSSPARTSRTPAWCRAAVEEEGRLAAMAAHFGAGARDGDVPAIPAAAFVQT